MSSQVSNKEGSEYDHLLNRRFEYNIAKQQVKSEDNNTTTAATFEASNSLYAPASSRSDVSRGFVRFIGKIDQASSQLFVGVEWDYEERGKHDGELNGVRYFVTSTGKKSASFIKLETFLRFSSLGIDFMQAVSGKYKNKDFKEEEMFIYSSSKKTQISVELVGRQDLESKLEKIEKLTDLGLQDCKVSSIEKGIGANFENVRGIDLSANLIETWSQVETLLEEFPKLTNLIISSNRFSQVVVSKGRTYPNLKMLVVNDVSFGWKTFVEEILPLFPNIEEVHFRDNNVTDEDLKSSQLPTLSSIQSLNLSGNKIANWDAVWNSFSNFATLTRLLLNYNALSSVKFMKEGGFSSLKSISVASNKIEEYDSLNELNNMPLLEELRLESNPIQEKYGVNNVRQYAVARIRGLISFNGSEVRKKEREDAEKYYLKQCGREKTSNPSLEITTLHPRYNELVKIYGDPCEADNANQGVTKVSNEFVVLYIKNVAASVVSSSQGHVVEKKIPYGFTIQKLKLMCQRLFKLEASKQRLFYIDVGHSLPEPLGDDFKDIDFYAVKDGGTIIMEEIDEFAQQKEEELKRKERERTIKEQEEQVSRELRWKQL